MVGLVAYNNWLIIYLCGSKPRSNHYKHTIAIKLTYTDNIDVTYFDLSVWRHLDVTQVEAKIVLNKWCMWWSDTPIKYVRDFKIIMNLWFFCDFKIKISTVQLYRLILEWLLWYFCDRYGTCIISLHAYPYQKPQQEFKFQDLAWIWPEIKQC